MFFQFLFLNEICTFAGNKKHQIPIPALVNVSNRPCKYISVKSLKKNNNIIERSKKDHI